MSYVTLTITMTRPSTDVQYFGQANDPSPDVQEWLNWIESNATQTSTSSPNELTNIIEITLQAEKWNDYITVATQLSEVDAYHQSAGITLDLNPVWHD